MVHLSISTDNAHVLCKNELHESIHKHLQIIPNDSDLHLPLTKIFIHYYTIEVDEK